MLEPTSRATARALGRRLGVAHGLTWSLLPYFLKLVEAFVVYMKRELDQERKDA